MDEYNYIDISLEALAFIFGLLSVWFAKRENIFTFPFGLIGTAATSYLLYKAGYFGDMTVNLYFTIASFYGWYRWSKKETTTKNSSITQTDTKQKIGGICLFIATIVLILGIYHAFDEKIAIVHWIDIISAGIFFTAMWYMALKKLESWVLWIIGNIIVVPIYFYRDLYLLAIQYILFTLLAISAYLEWRKKINIISQK